MKTIFKLIPLVSVAVFGACNDIIESAEAISIPEKEIVLTATREGVNPGTKSFRLDDGSVWWSPAEEVSVFYGSGSSGGSKFVSMNTAIAETVELQGSVQMAGSGKDFWAVYPYSEENSCDGNSITTVIPDQQTGVEGNFSNDAFPTVAKSSSLSLAFWNICGGVKFFVSRSDIKSVTFKGNNNEPLAGKVSVSFGTDGTPVVQEVIDAKAQVTIFAPNGAFKVGKYYYVTLLPAELKSGFTMILQTENTRGIVSSNKAQKIKRSSFGVLKNIDSNVSEWESTIDEPVDLGLSVKWATYNVGASKPEEYGDYFAWGETKQKPYYAWSTYKFKQGMQGTEDKGPFSKYVTNSIYGTYGAVDNKTILDLEDDVANAAWGRPWRMPSKDEMIELFDNCTSLWCDNYNDTGIAGFILTSNITGYTDKSIFLPAAGFMLGNRPMDVGSRCYYLTSSLSPWRPSRVCYAGYGGLGDMQDRCYGHPVRPVYGEYIAVESLSMNTNSMKLNPGDTEQLQAIISPLDAIEKDVRWETSDTWVASVDRFGRVKAVGVGSATITAYASSGESTTCTVTVEESVTDHNDHDYIDLGLGVKWATFNVGASKPEEYGDYFAWGETEPKSDYSWSAYKYRQSGDSYENIIFNKYCLSNHNTYWGGNGSPDNKSILDPEDDAAYVNWGGDWRMPTIEEWEELINNCIWTWTSDYNGTGIAGRIVTSKRPGYSDKSVFLPAAGYLVDNRLGGREWGHYWSSSLYMGYPYSSFEILFGSENYKETLSFRRTGYPIRPVLAPISKNIIFAYSSDMHGMPVGQQGIKDGTYTVDDYTVTLHATDQYYVFGHLYYYNLFIGKQDSFIQFPAIGGKSLVKVEFMTGLSASEDVIVDIAKADGTRLNINNDKLMKGAYYAWTIPGETDTAYRFVVTNDYYAQLQTITLTYE